MDTPPMISSPPAVSVGGFRDLFPADDAVAGVGAFPSGFAMDMPPSDAAASTGVPPKVPNFYGQLQSTLKGTPLASDPAKLAILLTIGAMHNFGSLPGLDTNNWLVTPLSPPCDAGIGRVSVPNYVPASCVQTYPTQQAGLEAFLSRLNEIGFLSFLIDNTDGNFTQFAAAIYPLPELSGVDPAVPLSTDGFKEFQVKLWGVLQQVVLPGLTPADADQAFKFWRLTEEVPPFGSPGPNVKNLKSLPGDKGQRLYLAAAFLANEWPWGQLPLANTVEAQTAIQGILAITYLFGDFGKMGQVETNNWFQAGSPASTTSPAATCAPSTRSCSAASGFTTPCRREPRRR
jgi:hypothetical protein